MTKIQAVDAIAGHFATAWGSTTRIAWDNKPFTPVDGTAFVRLSIQHNVEGQETVKDKLFVRRGIVFLQVFVPIDTGRGQVDVLVPQAQAAFENSAPAGIVFSNVTAREIGADGRWFQTNITVEFDYSEIR